MYIDSTHGSGVSSYLKIVWQYRHFLMHLVASDLRGRFRRTYLGIIWALLLPLAFASSLAMLFSGVFHQPWQDMVLYIYSGLIMWEFFSSSASRGADAFTDAVGYISQARLPVIIFPIRAVMGAAVYFLISLIGLILLILLAKPAALNFHWLYFPVFFFAILYICMPLAIISAFINVSVRDFQPVQGIILQFLSFLSPIFIVKDAYLAPALREFSAINPVYALANLFRDPLLYSGTPAIYDLLVVLVWGTMFWILAIVFAKSIDNKIIYYL